MLLTKVGLLAIRVDPATFCRYANYATCTRQHQMHDNSLPYDHGCDLVEARPSVMVGEMKSHVYCIRFRREQKGRSLLQMCISLDCTQGKDQQ